MKYTSIIPLIAALSLSNCAKTVCQKCTQTITATSANAQLQVSVYEYNACDEDLAAMKKRNGQTTTTTTGGTTVTVKEQWMCR